MAPSNGSVLSGAIINVVTAIIGFTIFALFRIWRKSHLFFNPKRNNPNILQKPHALPESLWGWVWPTFTYPEPDIIRHCGLDAAIYLRLLNYGFLLFAFMTVWCIVIIVPVNRTDDEIESLLMKTDASYSFSDFDKLSLSNVTPGSHRMWAHVVSVYVLTIVALYLLWRFSKDSVLLRIHFLANSKPGGRTHTVLVTDIPGIQAFTAAKTKSMSRGEKQSSSKSLDSASSAKTEPQAVAEGNERPTSAEEVLLAQRTSSHDADNPIALASPTHHSTSHSVSDAESGATDTSGGYVSLEHASNAPTATTTQEVLASPNISNTLQTVVVDSSGKVKNRDEAVKQVSDAAAGGPAGGIGRFPLSDCGMGPGPGATSSGAGGGVRKRKTYNYDVQDMSMDPLVVANEKLSSGTAPTALVRDEFELVYGDQVEEVHLIHDLSVLNKLTTEYDKVRDQAADYLSAVAHKTANKLPLEYPKVTLLFPDDWIKEKYGKGIMKKVDGIPFWKARLTWLEEQISLEQSKALDKMWPSAFVTFRTRIAQSIASTGMHVADERMWKVQPAPDPQEIVWDNLGMTLPVRGSAGRSMTILFWLMALFFMIPVAFIQALIEGPTLLKGEGIKNFLNAPVVKQLVEAIIPGLVLKVFLALVPLILATMARKSGKVSLSDIDFYVVTKFFIFQAIVVFAGNTIAGSFFNQLQQWIDDPKSVISVLGTAIPKASYFFITYIWVNLGTTAIGFTRFVGLILMWVFTYITGSPRAQERIWQEQYNNYGTAVAGHTLIMLAGLVYCLINPIIAPSALVYFTAAMLTEKYNNIYVYRRNYESAGYLWPRIVHQVMTCLYIFQLVMLGLLGVKKFPYTVLLIPVLPITLSFHFSLMALFKRPWKMISLHDAAELDIYDKAARKEADLEGGKDTKDTDAYLAPCFKVRAGDVAELIAELTRVEPIVLADVAEQQEKARLEKEAKKANKKCGCL